jgi:CubicO group peptidase (beta-lactamase class C family)
MPGGPRSLPGRPSLRYLRLEAKRRLAAGEFPTLHDAQTAIAREHGLPSWTALKQSVDAPAAPADRESHALAQLHWLQSRFAGADDPGWAAPVEDELREHFTEQVLAVLSPATLTAQILTVARDLRGEFQVLGQTPLQAQVRLADVEYLVAVEADPPHRVAGLRALPLGGRMHDPRVTRSAPAPARALGEVPAGVSAVADQACEELGLPALLLAGGTRQDPDPWVLARGWADLEREQPLDPGHRFPAPGVAVLVATTAVLRLVAEGRVGLDRPANDYLRAVRLDDDAVTVRDLLAHTGGVDDPAELYADAVQDLATLMGPVIGCSGPRGVVRPSNGGVAVLGQLIADVTRRPYADAVTAMVLGPLGMRDSTFPMTGAMIDPAAVTGYSLTLEGVFQPVPVRIPTIQAAGGLWSTGADLVRLGLGWSRLLPESLAHEALAPQAPQTSQAQQPGEPRGPVTGLGWLLSPRGDMAVHAGAGLDATASLAIRIRDQRTHVVLTSRMIPINSIEARLLRAWTNN